jgi:HEAT repeat protein
MELSEKARLPLRGQTARLEVRPRDPVHLEMVCTALAKKVEETLSVEEWQFPARMLGSINDPIAVPYLGRVLAMHKGTENIIIPSLERIGNDNAVDLLLSVLGEKSSDMAELARQSLTRMQGRIENPGLREAVRQALVPKTE